MSEDPIKVLIVDDHAMVVEMLERVVASEPDMEVVGVARSGNEALRAMSTHPDVVVLDYQLPDTDGASTAKALREIRPETKVVMLTGSTDDHVLVESIEAGCSGYVTKTNAVEELVHAVRAAHAGEAVISPAMLARLLPRLRPEASRSPADLTKREREVLELLAEGLSNAAIAERLYVSLNTVRNHVQNILTKLQVHSKLEAVSTAVRRGLISYPGS